LPPLGRLLSDSLGDLNVLRLLPEVTSHLRAIRRFTEGINAEVAGMHAGVVRLEGQVAELKTEVSGLNERVFAMEQRLGALEPHVADMSLAIRPLRRARARLPQRGSAAEEERSAGH
jgi:chromosome segregation ATPase